MKIFLALTTVSFSLFLSFQAQSSYTYMCCPNNPSSSITNYTECKASPNLIYQCYTQTTPNLGTSLLWIPNIVTPLPYQTFTPQRCNSSTSYGNVETLPGQSAPSPGNYCFYSNTQ